MKVTPLEITDVLLVEPAVHEDSRGFFFEAWHRAAYAELGIAESFVQDNVSLSAPGVLRGLHFQEPDPQAKLVSVLQGAVFDVAVDLRRQAPTFGRWVAAELSEFNHHQLFVPKYFAHGFLVTRGPALVMYKCSAPYCADADRSVRWNDPDLAIRWPAHPATVSRRDSQAPLLRDLRDLSAPHR